MALQPILKFHDALRAAGQKPEVHGFASGGHVYFWLEAQDLTAERDR